MWMGLEQKINYLLNQYPYVKKIIKRIYQLCNYLISPKKRFEGDIIRVSPLDMNHEYFFGYYDKSPWDKTDRYMLCLRVKKTWSDVNPREKADILLIDTQLPETDPVHIKKIADTSTWNVQQGCMLQWLGPDFTNKIIYNDCIDGQYVSVIKEIGSDKETIIPSPVYSVSPDGKFALSLDFSRLYELRPGYGYYNIPEKTKGQALPDGAAIWKIDLVSGEITDLLNYSDFVNFEPRPEMIEKQSIHKVNHIMISPNGKRFMVLYRWFCGTRKYSRLITCNTDGSDMYLLSDDDMVSHCCWKNNEEILAFENKKGSGVGFYLMKDKTQNFKQICPHLISDGHPSYNPDQSVFVIDSYPNKNRMQVLKIVNEHFNVVIAKVFSPFKYDNDTRCDLHPRWNHSGDKICFDSVFEGRRGLYYTSIEKIKIAKEKCIGTKIKQSFVDKKKIVYIMTSCKKTGPAQQTLNIIKGLDPNVFTPILITLYDEEKDSLLFKYLPYVSEHFFIKTSKKSILMGKDFALRNKLNDLHPDIIHTVGVFPDYAVCRMRSYSQVFTLRNYVYDDYLTKFGYIRGFILARMQISAIKRSKNVICCSKSLSEIYKTKLNMNFDYICNGVDVEQYTMPTFEEKETIRRELNLPSNSFIWVYTGQFIERKNVSFLLENYVKGFSKEKKSYLLLLGDGPEFTNLKNKYASYDVIDFRGNVPNVNYYLKACDVYISTSKSEGLPNGVLEAMATGLPVILSDIKQHKEIFAECNDIGFLYKQNDAADFSLQMNKLFSADLSEFKNMAYKCCQKNFSAIEMSKKYQNFYKLILEKENEKYY